MKPFKIFSVCILSWASTTAVLAQSSNGPFDGRWVATVGPQGRCNFTSTLTLDIQGSAIVGNARNPFGVFALAGRVDPSGNGEFRIGGFVGTIRFSGTMFEANYANTCGGRFAAGTRVQAPLRVNTQGAYVGSTEQYSSRNSADREAEIVARAGKLFPWASQGRERTKYITDEMRAAADRQQAHSYSIHVDH
jgi:hypothetical protein